MIPFFTTENADAGQMTGQTDQLNGLTIHSPAYMALWLGRGPDRLGEGFSRSSADLVQSASTVLDFLNKHEPVFTTLTSAKQRSACRFNIRYENWEHPHVESAMIQQLVRIKDLIRVLSLRAQAEMVSGRTDQAIDDIT